MKVYAISDLHLSGENPTKPMEVFDSQWAGISKVRAASVRAPTFCRMTASGFPAP